MSAEEIAALGAFCSGLAALITAILSNKFQKGKDKDLCDQRIEDIKAAFIRGTHFEPREEDEGEDRWSHLP